MDRKEAEIKLKSSFGIAHFYDDQWEAIDKILKGERILLIERTAFGKSLCYQFPATQFPGITIIFSPLIALMRDQVKALKQKGILAAYINSEQSKEDNDDVIKQALAGMIKILYIAPERQENEEWIKATREMKLSMIVIDEAHTISTWGHDFRPAFRRIIDLVKLLPVSFPILATTATATNRVQEDIQSQIGGKISTIRGSLIRSNLMLKVIKVSSEDEKKLWLAANLNKIGGTGLIYTGTRVDTESYSNWLTHVGINAVGYNAGLDSDTRKYIENGLMNNTWKCVVSTNALGMGIDKPDIRFIIHTQIPASPIHYYQEIGRAGRDGKPSTIILFYNDKLDSKGIPTDYSLPKSFIDNARPSIKLYERAVEKLKSEPLSERAIMKATNLKQTQVRVIKSDLIDQNIIKEVKYGSTKEYEYQFGAPKLDTEKFEALRVAKLKDLDSMVNYVYTEMPRMKYLCNFLDCNENTNFDNCDNTNLKKESLEVPQELNNKLQDFHLNYFPLLNTAIATSKTVQGTKWKILITQPNVLEVRKDDILYKSCTMDNYTSVFAEDEKEIITELINSHKQKKSRLVNGYAASYYGTSNVGTAIHRCKYENGGDFPDFLLKQTLRAFGKNFGKNKFDLVLYVPPTQSGDLVKNFASKFASTIVVQLSHGLIKKRITDEQKKFQNSYNKRENVADAFDIDSSLVNKKSIILIDDIFDSGATIKEIGKMLTDKGAKCIIPMVIAKTVGGTL